jgi:N-acetylmuramoyl-L-alanine amidase
MKRIDPLFSQRFPLKWVLILAVCFSLTSSLTTVSAQKNYITVVIDPGHGGSDPGHLPTQKNLLSEKAINLIIAQKFGNYIEQNLQNVKIIYTRTDDSYPSLTDRVNKANAARADYFISIHCNANHNKHVHGTESHVHSLKEVRGVALARAFEQAFVISAGRFSRGVKDSEDREHSLQVLKYTAMNSVLVECGFLTNEQEAQYLNTIKGQEQMASSIYTAFKEHIIKSHPSIAFVKSTPNETLAKRTINGPVSGAYAIQLMSSKEPIDTSIQEFKRIGIPVERKKVNSTSAYKYQYRTPVYASQDEAKRELEKVQKSGFKDAYIIQVNR